MTSSSDSSDTDVVLFIDAIEGDEAALLLGDKRYLVPRALLPAAAKEGGWLRLAVHESPETAKTAREIDSERTRLVGSDDGANLKL